MSKLVTTNDLSQAVSVIVEQQLAVEAKRVGWVTPSPAYVRAITDHAVAYALTYKHWLTGWLALIDDAGVKNREVRQEECDYEAFMLENLDAAQAKLVRSIVRCGASYKPFVAALEALIDEEWMDQG